MFAKYLRKFNRISDTKSNRAFGKKSKNLIIDIFRGNKTIKVPELKRVLYTKASRVNTNPNFHKLCNRDKKAILKYYGWYSRCAVFITINPKGIHYKVLRIKKCGTIYITGEFYIINLL